LRYRMKSPSIAKLNFSERKQLIEEVNSSALEASSKEVLAETVTFFNSLIEDLKKSKISIHKLKQLLGFHSEQLKKENQIK